jgi:predicted membrane-bound mannosyltransferase
MAAEYWPLPWYLRDYKNAGYLGKAMPTTATIVIASARERPELASLLSGRYRLIGACPLKPGVELLLYLPHGPSQ